MSKMMDMGFEKPTKTIRYPKIMIYGDAGTGKTWFAIAAGTAEAPAIVIDTESGTHFYGEHTGHHFIRKNTQSIRDANDVVSVLAGDESKSPVVVDSGSMMWELQQEAVAEQARVDDLQFHHWNKVKKPFKRFYTKVMGLPRPVIITAHEAQIFDEVIEHGKKHLKVVGYKPKFEGGASYVFDLVIRLRNVDGQRKAMVMKSRLPGFDTGKIIDNPTYHGIISEAYGKAEMGKTNVVQYDEAVATAKAGMTEDGDQKPDGFKMKDSILGRLKNETSLENVDGWARTALAEAKADGWVDELKKATLEARARLSKVSPGSGPDHDEHGGDEAVATPAEDASGGPAQGPNTGEVDEDGVPMCADDLKIYLKAKVDEAEVSVHVENIAKKYSDIAVKRGGVDLAGWLEQYCDYTVKALNREFAQSQDPPHPADGR